MNGEYFETYHSAQPLAWFLEVDFTQCVAAPQLHALVIIWLVPSSLQSFKLEDRYSIVKERMQQKT